jgi:DNA-binding transcriptional MerR regulator
MENQYSLTVDQVAAIAGCHRNTVLRYEGRGYIKSLRDNNQWRRYSKQDALKLKAILNIRKPVRVG